MREPILQNAGAWLAIGGFLIGLAFGAIVFRTNFCAMGAVSDAMSFGDYRRFRAWSLAAATAIAGAQILAAIGLVELDKSMYLTPNLNWAGNISGGLLFGFGMVLAGGCASRNLVRAGSGDLRAFMILLVMGLCADMASGGILGPIRYWLEQTTSIDLRGLSASLATQSIGDLVGALTVIGSGWGRTAAAIAVPVAIAACCFGNADFRNSPVHICSGLGVGLCAVAGWLVTGIAYDEILDKPVLPISLTYVRPTGDTLEWLRRFTAQPMPGFGVASVIGTLVGAAAVATAAGRFRLATFSDPTDTLRCLIGAAFMGVGGVMALGCTVGQAITGVSTLALGSFLTFASLVAGAMAGIAWLKAIIDDEA